MSETIKARVYGLVEIRVPSTVDIDYEEFREWYEEGGEALYEITSEDVIEFLKSSPDIETEAWAGFPKADTDIHEVWSAEFDEAEVLEVTS